MLGRAFRQPVELSHGPDPSFGWGFHAPYAQPEALHFQIAFGKQLPNLRGSSARARFLFAREQGFAKVREHPVEVSVRDNNVDQALRALKKKLQREGVFREMKLRRHFEKPSQRRKREKAEAVRRYRKVMRKRMEREGY